MNARVCFFGEPPWDGPDPELSETMQAEVAPDITLHELVKRIGAQHSAVFQRYDSAAGWWIVWLRHADGRFYPEPGLPRVVADDGALDWGPDPGDTRLRALLRSVDQGALDASLDPLCFWACPGGMGNGQLLLDWHAFLQILDHAASVLGVGGFLAVLVRAMWQRWKNRGASPAPWFEFILREKRWDVAKLSTWFSIEPEQARSWLTTLGYVQDPDDRGLFHFQPDEQSRELLKHLDSKMRQYDDYKGDAL